MQKYKLQRVMDAKGLLKKTPKKTEFSEIISRDTIFTLDGEVVGLYINLPKKSLTGLRKCALDTHYVETYRTHKALPTKSSVFGALPRIALRNDFCRFSSKTFEERPINDELFKFQKTLCGIYAHFLPEQFQKDLDTVRGLVDDDYRLVDTPYTTININVNHAIKYHRDTGNVKGAFSNVLILKENCKGGELVLPEYGVALAQNDGALCIFKGQEEIHGVMPLQPEKDSFYRASIVFYTLAQLKHCYPYKQEVTRLQKKNTQRAMNRVKNILEPNRKKK